MRSTQSVFRGYVMPMSMLISSLATTNALANLEDFGCHYTDPMGICEDGSSPRRSSRTCPRSEAVVEDPSEHNTVFAPHVYVCGSDTGEGAEGSGEEAPGPGNPDPVGEVVAPVDANPPAEPDCARDSSVHVRRAARYRRQFSASCAPHTAEQVVTSGANQTPACSGSGVVNSPFCAPYCEGGESGTPGTVPCFRPAREEFYSNAASSTDQTVNQIRTQFVETIAPGSPFDQALQDFKTKVQAMDARLDARPGPRSGWPQWLKDLRQHVNRAIRRIGLLEKHRRLISDPEGNFSVERIDAFAMQVRLLQVGCTYGIEGEVTDHRCARSPDGSRETWEKGNTSYFALIETPDGGDAADTTPANELVNSSAVLDQILADQGRSTLDPETLSGRLAELRLTRQCHRLTGWALREDRRARGRFCNSPPINDAADQNGTPPDPPNPPDEDDEGEEAETPQ